MNTLKSAICVLAIATCLPTLAQKKVKTDRDDIFIEKKEKLYFEPVYKAMLPTDTYAFTSNYPQLPLFATTTLGKKFGQLVNLKNNPNYVFEYSVGINSPKVEYIQVSDVIKNRGLGPENRSYIARFVFTYTFELILKDYKDQITKTYLLSDETTPLTYYCVQTLSGMPVKREPGVVAPRDMSLDKVDGWTTAELLALFLKNNQGNMESKIIEKLMEDGCRRARQLIRILMEPQHETSSSFKMIFLAKKQNKDFPELAAQLEELRNCFIQWARDQKDDVNMQKMIAIAEDFVRKGAETSDEKLQVLYFMDAALAYVLCKDYDKCVSAYANGMKANTRVFTTPGATVSSLYNELKTIDRLKQASDVTGAIGYFDIDAEVRKLQE